MHSILDLVRNPDLVPGCDLDPDSTKNGIQKSKIFKLDDKFLGNNAAF
jgi:hypothetical protein